MCRSRRYFLPATLLAVLLVPSSAIACLWDYDTVKMERVRFPGALELITGKFLRHSPEFYQWRVQNRLKRLESDPTNAALLDDLAVAYDKTGQHDKAVETAMKTERLRPGRYETAANLGTFHIHAGRLEEGVPHIERALKINPDAHFGREKYQKLLVEYVLHRRKGSPLRLPLADVTIHHEPGRESQSPYAASIADTFEAFVHRGRREPLTPEETSAAVKGTLGMMRFGKHDSPILLEALGTLLAQEGNNPTEDAKLLAARAFLKASYEVPDGPARATYRTMAARAIYMQTPSRAALSQISLGQVEADFQRELDDARGWYAELRERELSWIREGWDPEGEFDRLYATDPESPGMDVDDPASTDEKLRRFFIVGGIVFATVSVVAFAGAALVVRRLWARRSTSA